MTSHIFSNFWNLLAILFLGLLYSNVEGFKQELHLYTSNGQEFLIDENTPSISNSSYRSYNLTSIQKYCSRGVWDTYLEALYKNLYKRLGVINDSNLHCEELDHSFTNIKSLRHIGANDTNTDQISLYYSKSQQDLLADIVSTVTVFPKEPSKIVSIASTGTAKWTFFEGTHLSGSSFCFNISDRNPGEFITLREVEDIWPGYKINSVLKGCNHDKKKLESYRRKHFGYKQELQLYTMYGVEYVFTRNTKNVEDTGVDFGTILKMCCRGAWVLYYDQKNYKGNHLEFLGSMEDSEWHCKEGNFSHVKSFRHFASRYTATDSVSLYSKNMDGKEIHVKRQAYLNITIPIGTIAISGTLPWSFFKKPNLNDSSPICIPSPRVNRDGPAFFYISDYDSQRYGEIKSVFRGCNPKDVQLFKKEHKL